MALNAPEELAIEKRRGEVWDLQVSGLTYRQIAAKLNVSIGTVAGDMKALVERVRAENDQKVERERLLSLARNGKALSVVLPMLDDPDTAKDAVDSLDKLEKRRAALLGLDAPAKQELSGPAGAPIAIDARGSLIERIASLVASGASGGAASSDPGVADGSGSESTPA